MKCTRIEGGSVALRQVVIHPIESSLGLGLGDAKTVNQVVGHPVVEVSGESFRDTFSDCGFNAPEVR